MSRKEDEHTKTTGDAQDESSPRQSPEIKKLEHQLHAVDLDSDSKAQSQARLKYLEKALAQAQAKAEAAEAKAEIREKLLNGTFYTTIDQLWGDTVLEIKKNDHETSKRLKRANDAGIRCLHASVGKTPDTVSCYLETKNVIHSANLNAKSQASSSRSSVDKTALWPTDIFGERQSGEIAHLLPAASMNANTWWWAPEFLYGSLCFKSWDERMRAIHGAVPAEGGRRMDHTGIKHFSSNKIRLRGQAKFFDRLPCVLIVPILSAEGCIAWSGSGYSAIVVIDGGGEDGPDVQLVAREIGLLEEHDLATENEVEVAREVLVLALKTIHRSQQQVSDFMPNDGKDEKDEKGLCGLMKQFDSERLIVPTAQKTSSEVMKVCKVTFTAHAAAGETEGHIAPDPLLLLFKAAVMYSKRQRQWLAASAEPKDFPDDWSEGDQMHLEWTVEMWQQNLRPPDHDMMEFASRLGQPGGCQGDTVAEARG